MFKFTTLDTMKEQPIFFIFIFKFHTFFMCVFIYIYNQIRFLLEVISFYPLI